LKIQIKIIKNKVKTFLRNFYIANDCESPYIIAMLLTNIKQNPKIVYYEKDTDV